MKKEKNPSPERRRKMCGMQGGERLESVRLLLARMCLVHPKMAFCRFFLLSSCFVRQLSLISRRIKVFGMKRKPFYIALLCLCLVPLLCSCLPDEEIPDGDFDVNDLYGKWNQTGTRIYYVYHSDGTGYTWDEADDVLEDEAQEFTWEVDGSEMIHIHYTETGTARVPKHYIITSLTGSELCYHDANVTSKSYVFYKVY